MRSQFKKILVIGAGPVVIGQSSEFDYAGVQMCRVLRSAGIQVVVANSNPATVMTEHGVADTVYLEPLSSEVIKKIIEIEQPDAILATAGGKTGLEICLELSQNGYLEEHGAVLLGAQPEVIKSIHNAQALQSMLSRAGEPYLPADIASSAEEAVMFAERAGYPVRIQAAFSAESGGSAVCRDSDELSAAFSEFAAQSLVGQVHLQKCVDAYKEIELAVVRDADGNAISVCSTESMDTVGVHSGDSVIVLPAQTLTDAELMMLRRAARKIAGYLQIVGACMVRFALHPTDGSYYVLSVEPELNRTTALISKATGYPIASVCAHVALGERLYEIPNELTGVTTAANEPALDYCAVRVPKWSFEQFGDSADRRLGAKMKATGEAFAIGTGFELALLKAIRSIHPKTQHIGLPKLRMSSDAELEARLCSPDNERIFTVYEAIKRGFSLYRLHEITGIDLFFLSKLQNIADAEAALRAELSEESYLCAKHLGFLDSVIAAVSGKEDLPYHVAHSFNTVDTCAAEFDVRKPYFYSAWDEDNEAAMFLREHPQQKKKILVVGAGPTSIGLGTDRDYAAFLALRTLKDFGFETVMLNNNPAANTTDFAAADKLYVDPITAEDVAAVCETERPDGAILAFGGGEAVRKSELLRDMGITVYGADAEAHRMLKNKIAFFDILDKLNIRHTNNRRVMIGKGAEVDVLSDGSEFLIPGICEHIEKASVHSGDSISAFPAVTLSDAVKEEIVEFTGRLVRELGFKGLLNIQFVIYDNAVYVSSASVVATRNIPFLSKATALPIIEFATRLMLGETLSDIGIGTGLYKEPQKSFVRVPVFSFEQLTGTDVQLGGEMQSTGEVIGVGRRFDEALLKGFIASGMRMKRTGGVLISVADSDKPASAALAAAFQKLGFKVYATSNTAKLLNANHVAANAVRKIHEGSPNTLTLILQNRLSYLVSTAQPTAAKNADEVRIRRTALLRRIPVLPSVETAAALASCLAENSAAQELYVESL